MNSKDRIKLPKLHILNCLFDYDFELGVLYWKIRTSNRIRVGDKVGHLLENGYLSIRIFNKSYLVHRVIWKIHTWQEPPFEIDHWDTIRSNNRISNLRPANRHTNIANSKSQKQTIAVQKVLAGLKQC